MQVLLISTYELGRQPVHLASPAASLREGGHQVKTVDLAVEDLTDEMLRWAERVAISVPMHTATRMADQVVAEMKKAYPDLPVALFGLYAGVGSAEVDARFEGEYEPGLSRWVSGANGGTSRHLGRSDLTVPDRSGLPPLAEYARLEVDGTSRLVGAVEASHGCRHRCRHCPIPVVYDGRIRVVPADDVIADISNLAATGAEHITFGDADFLNAPPHSLSIIERAHEAHPELTFDATIKVEHLVANPDLMPRLADANLLFIVSAFESVDDDTLTILDKGHTLRDMAHAIELTREAGIHIRPTWLPFLPWTEPSDIADIFGFLDEHDLVGATDPVQMAIRLLIPKGSLLGDHHKITPHLDGYDEEALSWRWEFASSETAILYKELEGIAANASDCGQEAALTLNEMREAVVRVSGVGIEPFLDATPAPRLTESWYCCAEPTGTQAVSLQIGRR
jgi:hypothetical protein